MAPGLPCELTISGFNRRRACALLAVLAALSYALIARGQDPGNGAPLHSSAGLQATHDETESTLLEPGKAIRREIEAGGSHTFRIALEAGAYARVILEQQGIDVAVELRGPDRDLIAEFDDE